MAAAEATKIAVSVTMGVLKPILSKLTALLIEKCKKLKGVRKQLSFLQEELSTMYAFLEKLEPMDELDPSVNNWRSHVREMAYDIEDVIDDFTSQLGSEDGPKEGFLKRASRRLKALRARHQIASQISELKARVLEANKRHRRYKLDDFIPTSASTSIDPRLSALYNEASSLVGIENPKEELISMLMDERWEKRRVVSIVGLGGLGKTTLARKVYHEVGGQFNCKAFVSVSQTPDISRLLHGLLSQLGLPPPSCARELTDLIDYLREYLLTKRYLIVVDDLWDVPAWNIISCVFPENGKPSSRVIITTRQRDVAVSCSSDDQGVHSMRPLSDQDSRKLFNNRIFGLDSEDACPPEFTDVSCEILKKCGGLPLAIITVASILACQRTRLKEEWEHIKDCLAAQEPTNTTLNDMVHILDLSYKFLPRRLQTCFLYLGTYPEDFEIEKDDLVGKWVAEGFVSGSISRDSWQVAEGYLNELVNRSMIQHVPRSFGLLGLYKEAYYKVHDMMLEMILKKCRENNFAKLAHDQQEAMAHLQVKVRRLAVHISDAKDDTEVDVIIGRHLSQVRSLSLFGANCVPPLSDLRYLRVLFLFIAFPRHTNRVDLNLTCVSQLLLLKYLKVTCRVHINSMEVVLPHRIRSMQCLEKLEIQYLETRSIPPDIVELPCLSRLEISSLGSLKSLPNGICKVKSLRTLRHFGLPPDSSHHIIEGLGELTNLEELSLDCGEPGGQLRSMTAAWMTAWSSSLNKLSNLRVLHVESYPFSCCADVLSSWVSPPFPFLEQLDVEGWTFSTVPRWIGGLHSLQSLEFGVKEVSNFRICGMLPNLTLLSLRIEGDVPAEGIVISGSTGFKLLENFHLETRSTSEVAFEAGAMPNLRQLGLTFDQKESDKATVPAGLEHLGRLKRIQVTGAYTAGASSDTQDSFNAFFKMFAESVKGLPSQPELARTYSIEKFR